MADQDKKVVEAAPVMTKEQLDNYHEELRKELFELEFSQSLLYSNYKRDRIKRLKQRLGITDPE